MTESIARPSAEASQPTQERGRPHPTVVRRGRLPRRLGRLALISGVMAFGGLAWVGLREWDPLLLREATTAYRSGDFETAYRKSAAHLASRPMSRNAALIAARSLGSLNRAGEAEAYYRRAGGLDVDVLHDRALALIRARLQDRAIDVYGEILSRSPEDVTALRRLAVAQILLSRWNEALEVAGRLKGFSRGRVIGHTLAGVVYHDTARPEAAVVEFEQVIALDPDLLLMPLVPREQFWIYLTKDLVGLGRGDEARPYLARALAERQDPYLYDLLGESFWQEGSIEDAEQAWLRSIENNPRRAQPWFWLGNLELQRDRPERAVERLGRAVTLAPSAREPHYSLSQAFSRLGQGGEAARHRSIADRLRPEILTTPRAMGESRSH